jgi:hypothetical protein
MGINSPNGMPKKNTKNFRPKAHILRLLGSELIKSPIMAIYELVKNSYDADAKVVNVRFNNIQDASSSFIEIEDDGLGLTADILEDVWLEPGTDHRKPFDSNNNRIIVRSPIFNRVPMGEKGVGRFAVHKLGDKIQLITRPSIVAFDKNGDPFKQPLDYEIVLNIDWNSFSQSKYLEDIPITWETQTDKEKFYFDKFGGTKITVSSLNEPWTRRMARSLKRNSVSMLSPKNDETKFKANLDFQNDWLDGFPDAKEILDIAPYKYSALLDSSYNLTVDYSFALELNSEFGVREFKNKTENIKSLIIPKLRKELESELLTEEEIEKGLKEFKSSTNPFGDILLEIFSYDLDSTTLKNYTYDSKTLKNILSNHAGIKVFKDEMRVFDYGEPGNDWLELDIKRVNNNDWFSNNQSIGFVYLDSANSTSLIEKTSREGFIENTVYKLFYQSVIAILNDFKIERLKDRNKWLDYSGAAPNSSKIDQLPNFNTLIDATDFTDLIQKQKLKDEAVKLQKDFDKKKDTLLIPAGVGMTASVALHEIEKLVPRLKESINSTPFKKAYANDRVEELEDYLSGILSVLRKGGKKSINLSECLDKAVYNYKFKLEKRKIKVKVDHDKSLNLIICDKRYFITMVMNIIENSIYWLDTIYKDDKGIYIKTLAEDDSVSVIIVDNGPGFKDDITDIVRPFFTRKDDGIGIGMYLIDVIMMKYGKLEIIESHQTMSDFDIPDSYRGAAVKLTFKEGN